MIRQSNLLTVLIVGCLLVSSNLVALGQPITMQPKLYSKQAPVRVDFDMATIKAPETYETGYLYDFSTNTFLRPVKELFNVNRYARTITGNHPESLNVNTFDEVPNSSWFTNRNAVERMSLEAIKKGPNLTDGPASGRLTITKGKSNGITPGFQIKDERGDLYLLKFDPPDYPELSSAAEAISTRLFYAIGYNVPQNTIFHFRRDQLVIDSKAKFTDENGKSRKIESADVDRILKLAAKQSDGTYRCLASKFLSGKPVGNFKFHGTREDDPNDTIPHQHRRDLRALRLFAAWLNHNDIRNGNTLDMLVNEDDRQFIKHYLIDFGSTLGSDTIGPNPNEVGHAYQVDFSEARKSLLTLGIYQPHWRSEKNRVIFKSVGNYSAERFVPEDWKSNFPIPAFEYMSDRDGYWAARIIASFSNEQIRAAVETGQLSDPKAAEYLTQQIIKRRDAIVREYITRRPALENFYVQRASTNETQSGTAHGYSLLFADLNEQFSNEREAVYEYELAAAANPQQIIAQGVLSKSQFDLAPDLLKRIAERGNTEENRGVARLSLKQKGQSPHATIWLFYDDRHQAMRIIGKQN